jgi:RND family efflux transporter MFP subunit
VFFGCLAAAAAAVGGLVWAHEGHKALPTKGARVEGDTVYLSLDAHKSLGLTTAEIELRDLERTVTATASVVAPWRQHAYVTTRMGGKLARILCQPGELVQAGQKLAEIESLELENEQLELVQAQLELELAQQTLDRAESLGGKGIVPEREVRAAQSTKVEKTSAVEVGRRKLAALGVDEHAIADLLRSGQPVERIPVFSPIGGVVVHGDAQAGQIVEPTDHLFEVLDLSTVWVRAGIVEAETYRVRQGQRVRVVLAGLPGQTFEGKVDYMALQADPASRSVPVWIPLHNAEPRNPLIRPGMYGSATVVTEQAKQVVSCPSAALVTAGAETYVFVQQKRPGKDKPAEYVKRNVVLGLRTPESVEVKQGLFPGDALVLRGAHELSSFFVQGVLNLTLEAQRNIRLELEPVESRAVEDVVTVHASVEIPPERRGLAASLMPGKIARILVDWAEPVRRGQPLAELESLEFQNLQLELIQVHTRLTLLRDLLQRARDLKTIVAQQEVLQRETEVRKAQNLLAGLKRKLQAIGLSAGDVTEIAERGRVFAALPVRSPIDGHVVHFDVIPGQVVRADQPLFEIHDLSKVWVRGYVRENDLARVRLDQPVRVRPASDPHRMAEAKLARTNYVLSAERVLSVWAELDNPDRSLKNHMLARMTISTGASAAVPAVPVSAIVDDGSLAYVFVKRPEQRDYFDRREVQVGRRDDRFVEIRAGVRPGELVATGGVQALRSAHAAVR